MVFKVCIKCDQVIEDQNDQVDYDVFADYFKLDRDGMISGTVSKPIIVHFHLKCFKEFKKENKKKHLRFAEEIGERRLIIKES